MMDLDPLKTFHHVAQLKSFTKAAQKLYLTQPAVSQQIQRLEHSLRVSLFDRSKKQIELTPQGEILFSYTRKLFHLFDDIEVAFEDFNNLESGHISIGASSLIGTYYLPDMLEIFHDQYPNVTFNVRIGNSEKVAKWVMEHDVDLGLSARIMGKKDIIQYQLLNEPYRAVASPRSRWAKLGRALTAQEFSEASIVTREKGARSQNKLDEWLDEQGLPAYKGGFTVDSMQLAKNMAISGLGVVTLPELATIKDVKNGLLVNIHVENFHVTTGYYLIYRTDSNLSPAALKFLMLLKEHRRDFMAIL